MSQHEMKGGYGIACLEIIDDRDHCHQNSNAVLPALVHWTST
jgi:hypothetical protein